MAQEHGARPRGRIGASDLYPLRSGGLPEQGLQQGLHITLPFASVEMTADGGMVIHQDTSAQVNHAGSWTTLRQLTLAVSQARGTRWEFYQTKAAVDEFLASQEHPDNFMELRPLEDRGGSWIHYNEQVAGYVFNKLVANDFPFAPEGAVTLNEVRKQVREETGHDPFDEIREYVQRVQEEDPERQLFGYFRHQEQHAAMRHCLPDFARELEMHLRSQILPFAPDEWATQNELRIAVKEHLGVDRIEQFPHAVAYYIEQHPEDANPRRKYRKQLGERGGGRTLDHYSPGLSTFILSLDDAGWRQFMTRTSPVARRQRLADEQAALERELAEETVRRELQERMRPVNLVKGRIRDIFSGASAAVIAEMKNGQPSGNTIILTATEDQAGSFDELKARHELVGGVFDQLNAYEVSLRQQINRFNVTNHATMQPNILFLLPGSTGRFLDKKKISPHEQTLVTALANALRTAYEKAGISDNTDPVGEVMQIAQAVK